MTAPYREPHPRPQTHPGARAHGDPAARLTLAPPPSATPSPERGGLKVMDITEFYSERGGGIRSHLTQRGRYLASQSHKHWLFAPGSRNGDESLDPEHGATGLGASRLVRLAGPTLPYDRSYHLLHQFGTIRQRVQAERPHVLEVHSPYLAAAAALGCGQGVARLRTAFWHSDHVGVHAEPALTRVVGKRAAQVAVQPLWRSVRALLSPFDATFVAGRGQATRLRQLGVRNVVHAPFGVDKGTFRPGARSLELREKLLAGEPPGSLLLVGAGRFAYEKRWDVVLDAFALIRAWRPATLVLFGDGPERARLERRAPSGVLFPGFETDRGRLAAALASADALVHASPYETFGLGIAEAIACGTPVVVPDAGGAAEHAEFACAETYASLDSAACAAAVRRLFGRSDSEVRARSLGAVARARSIEQHFQEVLAVYADRLKSGPV